MTPNVLVGVGWYALLLGKSNDLIDYGASMLLLVVDPGLICGFVIPLLEAVPGAAMVLFSGIGPASTVQQNINVGMGSLAGSTVLLLTIPWAASVFSGRVDIADNGESTPGDFNAMPLESTLC